MLFNFQFVCIIIMLINLKNFNIVQKSICVHRLTRITCHGVGFRSWLAEINRNS